MARTSSSAIRSLSARPTLQYGHNEPADGVQQRGQRQPDVRRRPGRDVQSGHDRRRHLASSSNNFTTIKDTITGTLTYSTGNQFFTISGTGTLVLAGQNTYSFPNQIALPTNTANSTLLLGGPALRLASSSTVTGTFGSQTLVSGPLGKSNFSINGAGGNVGSFLQDNGTNITLANTVVINTVNPLNLASTGNGSITFDGTGLTSPSVIDLLTTATLGLLAENTVIVNDRVVSSSGGAAVLTIGNNKNVFPYGTVILNQPANTSSSGATVPTPGSTYSGGFNANFGTVVLGASSALSGTAGSQTLVSGPAGTGTFTMAGNFPVIEDNGTTISVANAVNTGGNVILASADRRRQPGLRRNRPRVNREYMAPVAAFNLTGSGAFLIGNTTTIKDQITSAQQMIMLGTGKLVIDTSPISASLAIANTGTGGVAQITVPANTGLVVNQVVTAPGLPAGTRIASISGTTITLNNAATATGTQAVRFGETYQNTVTNAGITQLNDPTSFGIGIASASSGFPIVQSTVNYSGTLAAGPGTRACRRRFSTTSPRGRPARLRSPPTAPTPITSRQAAASTLRWSASAPSGARRSRRSSIAARSLLMAERIGSVAAAACWISAPRRSIAPRPCSSAAAVQAASCSLPTLGPARPLSASARSNWMPPPARSYPAAFSCSPAAPISTGASYGALTTNLLPLLTSSSAGTIALGSNSSENLNFSSTPLVSLGAEQGTSVTYSGTFSPVAGVLQFGGGSGSLTVSTNLTGASSVTAFGSGSGGTLIPTGTNSYSGGTTLLPGATSQVFFNGLTPYTAYDNTAGVLQLNSSSVVAGNAIQSGPLGTGTLTLAGGKLFENGTAVTIANSVMVNGSTTMSGDTGSFTFDGTGLSTPATFQINNGSLLNITNTTTIADNITGGTGLTKAGTGTLILGGAAKSYSGPTNVLGGTLRTTASNILPSGTTLNVVLGAAKINYSAGTGNNGAATVDQSVSGTVDLNGTSQSVNALIGTGYVTNSNATGASLNIGGAGGSGQFYGIIKDGAGTVALTKSGSRHPDPRLGEHLLRRHDGERRHAAVGPRRHRRPADGGRRNDAEQLDRLDGHRQRPSRHRHVDFGRRCDVAR